MTGLRDDNGFWNFDQSSICNMITSFFFQLYRDEGTCNLLHILHGRFEDIDMDNYDVLCELILDAKFCDALFDMNWIKSPVEDGIHAIFYQSQ